MAVELRCPDCRARLRLKESPDPGTEVECPECEHVFPAPDPDTGEVPDSRGRKRGDDGRPRKKRDDDGEDRPKPKVEANGAAKKKKGGPKTPKRRKAKKQETNKTLMILLIVGVVIFVSSISGLLIWFFSRKPAAYELMKYLPADADAAVGLNIGHMQKYPGFFDAVEQTYTGNAFKRAADALAKAFGMDVNEMLDYMVEGTGSSGSAIVIRTKEEFDPELLLKLPGAREGTSGGQKYYAITNIRGAGDRVFAPTNRIVVFCPGTISKGTFDNMLAGNVDNEETLALRAGSLAKRTVRGTYWVFATGGVARAFVPPAKKDALGGSGGEFHTYVRGLLGSATFAGFKASVGSRSVRFEFIVHCEDSDASSDMYEKFKSSDLAKGDDALEPPRYWKDFTQQIGGDRKINAELLSAIGAKTSGDLYIIYSECETKTLMSGVGTIGGKLSGGAQAGSGGGIGPGGEGGAPQPGLPGGIAVPGMGP
jgi:hypothetical protein